MKYFLLSVLTILLVACTEDEVLYANTPDKAIQKLTSEFVDNFNSIQEIDISENRKIYILEDGKAISENQTEYFIAIVEKQDKGWVVLESVGIGTPWDHGNTVTGGNYFEAGFVDQTENLLQKENQYIFNLPEKEYGIWVELRNKGVNFKFD